MVITIYENEEAEASVLRLRGAEGPECTEGFRSGCLPRGSVQDAAKALAPIRSLHPSGICGGKSLPFGIESTNV